MGIRLTQLVYGLSMLEMYVNEHPGVTGTFWRPRDFGGSMGSLRLDSLYGVSSVFSDSVRLLV